MTTTFNMYKVIRGELTHNGFRQFHTVAKTDDGQELQQINFNNRDHSRSIVGKIVRYDDDISMIVTDTIFGGYTLPNQELDRFFKALFVRRFATREVKFQTLERFQFSLIASVMAREDTMKGYWDNLTQYLSGQVSTNSSTNTKDGNNYATQELPQDSAVADLTQNILEYADNNSVSRSYADTNNKTQSTQFNTATLYQLSKFWVKIIKDLDKELFLQIW